MLFKQHTPDEVQSLTQEIKDLENKKQKNQALIQELKNQLYDQKEKSKYINEALNDALMLSEKITNEATLKAKLMLKEHEAQLQKAQQEFEGQVHLLSQLESQIWDKEERLKFELKHFIQVLSDKLDKFDTGALESITSKLEQDFVQMGQELTHTQNIAELSNQLLDEDLEDELPIFYKP